MLILDIETTHRPDAADFIDPPDAPSNYKDEGKIAAYKADKAARALELAACAPDLNRIVLIGVIGGLGHEEYHWCHTHEAEAMTMRDVWSHVDMARAYGHRLVTFGGLGFDWPTMARRSQILGVPIPDWFSLDKYRSPLAKSDLAHVLTFGGSIGHHRSLRTYCRLFGIPCEPEEFTGADIPRLYAEGRFDEIAQKNAVDLRLTRALAERVLSPAAVAQEA